MDHEVLSSLNEIIGRECSVKLDFESSVWSDFNTVNCKVLDYTIQISEFPGALDIILYLKPLKKLPKWAKDIESLKKDLLHGAYSIDDVRFSLL